MIEYYNKVKEGFEYCKANLEGDISYDQFMSCQQLCKNLHKLCEFYLSKLDKGNYEYAEGVWQGYLNTLLSMVQSWQSQWDKAVEEQEAEDTKKKDIWMQMMVAEEFRKYKEKKDKKSSKPIVGFAAYSSAPKKKGRKKKEDKILLNKKDVE
jgi:hypothetical protein